MDTINIIPIWNKQTNFSSLIFGGEFHMNFPLSFSTIKELVILLCFGIPNPREFLKSKS